MDKFYITEYKNYRTDIANTIDDYDKNAPKHASLTKTSQI